MESDRTERANKSQDMKGRRKERAAMGKQKILGRLRGARKERYEKRSNKTLVVENWKGREGKG